ncbi:S-formylglutathione hydrolase [Hanseniaspora uvarum]|nr:S-formylglutathione hydrolase [Hanseniaspora uvarum]
MSFSIVKEIAVCKGKLYKLTHESSTVKGNMNLNLYVPSKTSSTKIPTIYYLSGLTCSPDNCTEKGFVQFQADKYGFAVVYPDTSPRNVTWPKDVNIDTSNWALGEGAGFYLNSDKFENFKMFDYICKELPVSLNESEFGKTIDFIEKRSIMGHSMGGMGALNFYLKGKLNEISPYVSCSAFAPVANPTDCPWGVDAFEFYFEKGIKAGEAIDPTLIIGSEAFKGKSLDILITTGDSDPFFKNQLRTENFIKAVEENNVQNVTINIEKGFDHSYFFVSTFVPQHCEFHAQKLGLI